MKEKIPVTIVTGFLGAGKTSLLNMLIKQHPFTKFAIIENEFGELSVDGGLLATAKENIFELSNGCICCSLQSEFSTVIDRLLSSPYPFNHLLIETTGIANPATVIRPFLEGDKFPFLFELNAVVCLIDANNYKNKSNNFHEIHRQIAMSDTLIINKTDLITQEELNTLTKILHTKNPMATIFPNSYNSIDTRKILQAYSYREEQIASSIFSYTPNHTEHKNDSQLITQPTTLSHTIESVAFEYETAFDVDTFSSWIRMFVTLNQQTIFRIKGILCFANLPGKFILQVVGDIVTFESLPDDTEKNTCSKLVFIGTSIPKKDIEISLRNMLA